MANAFRMTKDGRLDREYLRICAVGRLVDQGRVGRARAVELLEQRGVKKAGATVDIWLARHKKTFSAMKPAGFAIGEPAEADEAA